MINDEFRTYYCLFFPAFLFPNACPCIMIRACLYFIQKKILYVKLGEIRGLKREVMDCFNHVAASLC